MRSTSSSSNQSRHTLGGRAVKKFAAGGARVDVTLEGYYQFGEIGGCHQRGSKNMDIEAYAFHIDGGVTLPVPMQPRLSAEFNMASGNKGDGKWRSFDQLYPTNHIHFGYMDRMSWKNMNHLGVRPPNAAPSAKPLRSDRPHLLSRGGNRRVAGIMPVKLRLKCC